MWLVAVFALAGGAAQLVDGTLGMGFGVTSATILLSMGVTAAAASAATHAAKLPTTFVSGMAHWRQGNVDTGTFLRIAVPGALMAFIGAVVLVNLSSGDRQDMDVGVAPPPRAGDLLALRLQPPADSRAAPRAHRTVALPIGALGGLVDSLGGGGWGPVVTPSLMTVTHHEPRKVVGSVNAAEFFVALFASAGFLTGAEKLEYDMPWFAVLGLVTGGVIVAPFAARLAGRLPHHVMGTLVGGLILLVNGQVLLLAAGVAASATWWVMAAAAVATAVVAKASYVYDKAERGAASARETSPTELTAQP